MSMWDRPIDAPRKRPPLTRERRLQIGADTRAYHDQRRGVSIPPEKRYDYFTLRSRKVPIEQALKAIGLLAALLFAIVLPKPAPAHDAPTGWDFPISCCHKKDCREMPAGSIRDDGKGGYVVISSGQVIPYEQVRHAPDGRNYWCTWNSPDGLRVRGPLYEPNEGPKFCIWIGQPGG